MKIIMPKTINWNTFCRIGEKNTGTVVLRKTSTSAQVPKITIKRKTNGLDLLSEQNRMLVNDTRLNRTSLPKVYRYTLNTSKLQRECEYFEQITGAKLHVPSAQAVDYKFANACTLLENMAREGNFPKDIKHVLIGHGMGSSVNGDWQIINGGGYVHNYINRNIQKGEKVLVLSCENGSKVSGKYGIGDEVELSLMNMNKPAKIVESGKNEIIGDLYFPPRLINQDIIEPCITYYDVPKLSLTIRKH